ncbi:MAG TPA: signal recognition particle protein [Candidatus Stercoripulliclostridium merdipullorum]|uniref:Signal recognition particle protein n=1 Tax=Candidatus Stercoripulliclostridium merdipullorum TaxID=2840952 RepID=A0A9D1SXL4_9FIRM|nr:signal recognition particle protein [Candidatus Stercoripulliclostridium merdipullorum]
MAILGNLSEKISHAFAKLKNRGALTELEIKEAMREVRIALLEADVNFVVVKNFIKSVSDRALGENILKGLDASQQVIKIVNEELIALMGSKHAKLAVSDRPPTVIMMCGLQGAGKTTMCGKLATILKKDNKKVLLAAGDIYRPAAIKQLQIVGEKAGVEVFEMGQTDPVKIAREAVDYATKQGFDTVIVDTAGRLHIDEQLMEELRKIKQTVNPTEILLVVDAMLGQDSVNVAETFNRQLDISGVILTKLDGDTRGGAALSIRAICGKPIKYVGVGEKMTDLEAFHPDRMASRILGMGDVLTLIEKAQNAISEEDAIRMTKKLKDRTFDLNDYLEQLSSVKKMGNLSEMVGMIPGLAGKLKGADLNIDEKQIERTKAIICSMTPSERAHPEIIKGSRRKRIAKGSGTQIQDVNRLLNQFEQTKNMMKMFGSGKRKLPF